MNKYRVTFYEEVTSHVQYRLVRQAESADAAKEMVLAEYYKGLPPPEWEAHSDEVDNTEPLPNWTDVELIDEEAA